jgi:hypothetical protein
MATICRYYLRRSRLRTWIGSPAPIFADRGFRNTLACRRAEIPTAGSQDRDTVPPPARVVVLQRLKTVGSVVRHVGA